MIACINKFEYIIQDIEANKKLSPIITELFMRGRKIKILVVVILQSYFEVPKFIRVNKTYYFIMKIEL